MQLFKIEFLNSLEYRFNFFWLFAGNIMSFAVLFLFFQKVFSSKDDGYFSSDSDIFMYYLLSNFIQMINYVPFFRFADQILDGDIVNTIIKPIKLGLYWFIGVLPSKFFTLIIYALILVIFRSKIIYADLSSILFFTIAMFLGMIGYFLINYILCLLTFFFKRSFGLFSGLQTISALFSGQFIPPELLPNTIEKIGNFLPFRYFVYLPIEIYRNTLETNQLFKALILEAAWCIGFFLLAKFTFNKSIKNFESIGL